MAVATRNDGLLGETSSVRVKRILLSLPREEGKQMDDGR